MIKPSSHSQAVLLAIAYIGFVSLGLPDPLIGVAWPFVRETFDLPQGAVAMIFFGSGCSYFVSSFLAGRLLTKMGIGLLLAGSSALVAMSGVTFGLAPLWLLFASGALLHGLGSGAIDAGLNHYVASHFSARHMNWLHACYSLGATLGPLIMTAMIASSAYSWRAGYLTVAGLLLALSAVFLISRRLWDAAPACDAGDSAFANSTAAANDAATISTGTALQHPMVWLHILLFFVYTGLEVTLGQWSFTLLTESRTIGREQAGLWVTIYWASIGVGRVLFGFIVDRFGIDRLLRASTLVSCLGVLLFFLNLSPWISAAALALAGLGLAAIFPCMMTRTPQRLGQALAVHAIGFQVGAAMLGAAALPSLAGFLAQHFGTEAIASSALGMAAALLALHEVILQRGRGVD